LFELAYVIVENIGIVITHVGLLQLGID